MKKQFIALLVVFLAGLLGAQKGKAQNIADLAAQIALDVAKLSEIKSTLKELKKGYQIVSKGYGAVKDISEGNFNIHKTFLDGLMAVSPGVKKYYKVPQIINYQISLIREQKQSLVGFKQANNFSAAELNYFASVGKNLVNESLQNLDELVSVTTAGKLRMSDDERLKAIDRIHSAMQDKLLFLRSFNQDNSLVSLQREREKFANQTLENMHGLSSNKN